MFSGGVEKGCIGNEWVQRFILEQVSVILEILNDDGDNNDNDDSCLVESTSPPAHLLAMRGRPKRGIKLLWGRGCCGMVD